MIRPEPVLRFSSLILVRDAVLAAAGVALLPRLLVADDVAAGRLVGAKVRAFLDVLDEAFPQRIFAPLL